MSTLKITKNINVRLSAFRLFRDANWIYSSRYSINIMAAFLLMLPLVSFSEQSEPLQLQEEVEQIEVLEELPEDADIADDELAEDPAVQEEQGRLEDELGILDSDASSVQISTQLRESLESQFQQIQSLIKTEDAYSPKLGEEYLSYGLLLKRAGRVDEAREMIVDALHISKVNDGVYSIEQRPMLRALFETNLLLGKSEELVDNFEKIVWLEKKNPSQIGTYSFDLALKLGHHFLDRYKIQTIRSNLSLEFLDSSARYFSYAVRQYGRTSIDELLMPYGELSEVHFYRSKLVQRISSQSGFSSFGRRDSSFDRLDRRPANFTEDTFSKTEFYAKLHFTKAQAEENQQQIVSALLALGDANLLFKRKKSAASYYKIAWQESLKLTPDDPIRLSLGHPVRLPAFNYALEEKEEPKRQGASYAYLPVNVNIDVNGKVTGVEENVVGASSNKEASRARRIIKNSTFRPVIENGELTATAKHQEKIRVLVSK